MNARRLVLIAACWALMASPAFADGQGGRAHHTEAASQATPIEALASANDASRQRPSRAAFEQARHIYSYEPGAIYELYANPNYVSTILLEPGETLNTIAAGDTARWMVTQAEGETESGGQTIVLIKPQAPNLRTNIVLITDRRTYLVEAISQTGAIYSAQVAWRYLQSADATPTTSQIATLNFNYRVRTVRGRSPVWAPARVFDDGRRTWVEFAPEVAASDMAPLFVITPDGAELVNYRVQGQRYMVDRIFDVAELRLGTRAPTVVRIERNPHVTPTPPMHHGPHR